MYKYMRDNLKDEYGILELQDKILETMVYLDDFLKRHDITYYIYGGSTLGAVRHHGFIPWDDDFDIAMDSKNYEKFLKVCDKDLDKEKYYLQKGNTEEYPNYYSKIRVNKTTYIEKENKDNMHQGIFIDVFCLDNAPDGKFARKIQYISAVLLKAKAISSFKYETNSIKKKMVMGLSKLIVRGKIKNLLYKNVKKYNNSNTVCYTDVLVGRTQKNIYWPKEFFKCQKYVEFEKIRLPIPIQSKNLLELQFGKDYMTPKVFLSHNTAWSTKIDYKEYGKDNNK